MSIRFGSFATTCLVYSCGRRNTVRKLFLEDAEIYEDKAKDDGAGGKDTVAPSKWLARRL